MKWKDEAAVAAAAWECVYSSGCVWNTLSASTWGCDSCLSHPGPWGTPGVCLCACSLVCDSFSFGANHTSNVRAVRGGGGWGVRRFGCKHFVCVCCVFEQHGVFIQQRWNRSHADVSEWERSMWWTAEQLKCLPALVCLWRWCFSLNWLKLGSAFLPPDKNVDTGNTPDYVITNPNPESLGSGKDNIYTKLSLFKL